MKLKLREGGQIGDGIHCIRKFISFHANLGKSKYPKEVANLKVRSIESSCEHTSSVSISIFLS